MPIDPLGKKRKLIAAGQWDVDPGLASVPHVYRQHNGRGSLFRRLESVEQRTRIRELFKRVDDRLAYERRRRSPTLDDTGSIMWHERSVLSTHLDYEARKG